MERSSMVKTPIHDDESSRPRRIGKYDIYETLGKGGYSWVKRGIDTDSGATVALKFMARAQDQWAIEQAEQVRTEIKSLTNIHHPNVMRLYAYNLSAKYPTADGGIIKTILLVLEYCPGGEIFDILYYADKIDKDCARTYLHQMINGLEACHARGIAHRDIKPQNLLLDEYFQVKITDFGLSKIMESDEDFLMRTTYVGTRGYQAPELLNNRKYTNSCDIFSMGVVVFIMLCGYPPFERAHKSDRWYRPLVKGKIAEFWHGHRDCGIPEECKDLVTGMLAYKPNQRLTIDQIKKHPFWSNGKTLDKMDLKKKILQKYEEARRARAKDRKKMKDLENSVSRSSGGFSTDLSTPVVEDMSRKSLDFLYTPLSRPTGLSMCMLRRLIVEQFPVEIKPAAWQEDPFNFKMTLCQRLHEPGSEPMTIKHVVQVRLRRDPKRMQNMFIFNLVRSEDRMKWIKIWRKLFFLVHEYGIAESDDKDRLSKMQGVRSEGFLQTVGINPMAKNRSATDLAGALDSLEVHDDSIRVTKSDPAGAMMCGIPLLCGGGDEATIEGTDL